MSSFSASRVHDPPAEDAVVPSGALHHPHEGQELGCSDEDTFMVQDPPAGDAMMPSRVLCCPCEDPELVGSALPTSNVSSLSALLLTWELGSSAKCTLLACIAVDLSYVP